MVLFKTGTRNIPTGVGVIEEKQVTVTPSSSSRSTSGEPPTPSSNFRTNYIPPILPSASPFVVPPLSGTEDFHSTRKHDAGSRSLIEVRSDWRRLANTVRSLIELTSQAGSTARQAEIVTSEADEVNSLVQTMGWEMPPIPPVDGIDGKT